MPRRRQRFSDLERQFRESGGVAAPGSRLAGYIAFKKGENQIEISKKLTAAERKRYGFAVIPFGVSPSGTTPKRYAAPITVYSNTQRTALGLTNAKLGYADIDAGTEQAENFYPALLRVFVKSSDVKTSAKSAVTQKKYSRTPGATYSFPFGRTTSGVEDAQTGTADATLAEVDEEDVRKSLSAFVRTKTNVASVSYEPEVFKVGKQDLASPPG